MIAFTRNMWTVRDLMHLLQLDTIALAQAAGVEPTVVEAIAELRYTPSFEHRLRISAVLGVNRSQIIWGHAAAVDHSIRFVG